uniref:Uncharacterized protein n=2 Tax=Ditylenchus dipsaci TaxID=166011 RepID=A0A915EDL1_9BILA
MVIIISTDLWLEVLTYLGVKDVKNLIFLSNLAFSQLIVYYASKVGFMKMMLRPSYAKTGVHVANLDRGFIGYELRSSKEVKESPRFASRVIQTGIQLTVPVGLKAKIFNAANPGWALMTEKTLTAGKHLALKIEVQSIYPSPLSIAANETVAVVFFQDAKQQTTDCYLTPSDNVRVRSQGVVEVPVQVFNFHQWGVPAAQPSLNQGSIAMVVGESKFRMGQELFVVPQLLNHPLPDCLSVKVVNCSDSEMVLLAGQPLALFSTCPYQEYDLELVQ